LQRVIRRIKELLRQCRRDEESITIIRETREARTVIEQQFSRLEVDAEEVAQRVVVFGFRQPRQRDVLDALLLTPIDGIETFAQKHHDGFALRGGWKRLLGRHFFFLDLLEHRLPQLELFHDILRRAEVRQIDIAFLFVGVVAVEAVFLEKGADVLSGCRNGSQNDGSSNSHGRCLSKVF